MTLTETERCMLENALITAAAKYDECAAAMRAQEAIAQTATPGAPNAATVQCAALAAQFDAQATNARQLAATVQDAAAIHFEL